MRATRFHITTSYQTFQIFNYAGINLAMAKSPAGASLDLINIMVSCMFVCGRVTAAFLQCLLHCWTLFSCRIVDIIQTKPASLPPFAAPVDEFMRLITHFTTTNSRMTRATSRRPALTRRSPCAPTAPPGPAPRSRSALRSPQRPGECFFVGKSLANNILLQCSACICSLQVLAPHETHISLACGPLGSAN